MPRLAARRARGLVRQLLPAVVATLLALTGVVAAGLLTAAPAAAAPAAPSAAPVVPDPPAEPGAPADPDEARDQAPGGGVTVELNGVDGEPSTPITILLATTVLGIAPALLLMCTSFTKIVIVLGLVRNALGLMQTPPNQVIVGLALFLSLFVMAPTLSEVNELGLQPYLSGAKLPSEAFADGVGPLREFMLAQTRKEEIALMTQAADREFPATREDVPLTTLVPAFMLSEIRSAFIIGFVIFIPFLVIDIVVGSALMSMGMMMLPPVMISLPFKLLLFVLVDGWGLVVTALLESYAGAGGVGG